VSFFVIPSPGFHWGDRARDEWGVMAQAHLTSLGKCPRPRSTHFQKSWWQDSNLRPADYKSAQLWYWNYCPTVVL